MKHPFRAIALVLLTITMMSCSGGDDGPRPMTWSTPAPIETGGSGDSIIPELAFDTKGNAFAVWYRKDESSISVWVNRYTMEGGWGTAQMIDNGEGLGGAVDWVGPQIAVDTQGNSLAVWVQNDGARNNVWSNRYTCGEGWGTAELIETDDSGDLDYELGYVTGWPRIVMDTTGNALAVWSQNDGVRNSIWSNRYIAGSGWQTAQQIESNDEGDAIYPDIAIDENGNAVAVWTQYFNDGDDLYPLLCANHYISGTGWEAAQKIGDGYFVPQVVFDSENEAIVVWDDSYFLRSIRFSWENGWENGWDINSVIASTDSDKLPILPQIAIDSNDNSLVVWGSEDVSAILYSADSGWGFDQTIGPASFFAPQIAVGPSGHALAMWTQAGEEHFYIGYNTYAPTSGWGSAGILETIPSLSARWPQMAYDAEGDAMAVWEQWDGSRLSIWSSRLE